MANIIDAIINLVNHPVTELVPSNPGRNRVNNVGDGLEEYVKTLFSGSFGLESTERTARISAAYSYVGNTSNPPDAMLLNGDAIEVKKIESATAALALNSSYPKQTLRRSSPMISATCKAAEGGRWTEKDMLYIVGVVDKQDNLRHLCMVYGQDYCAADEVYSRVKATIKFGVETIPGISFSESRELGHVNRVDPLGITYMRIRGMWGILNPWIAFSYLYRRTPNKDFTFMSIINDEKWAKLENRNDLLALAKTAAGLHITDVSVKNPDNPALLRGAKLIEFSL